MQTLEIRPQEICLPTKTILGFSVGDEHAIILGDICGEVPIMDEPEELLEVLNEEESMNSSKMSKVSRTYSKKDFH